MDDIAVLIPCYNEDKTIEKVVSDFKRVLTPSFMCTTIIQQMTQRSLQKRQEL